MKKLIPALCMLLVAAALMGTSTYAWFSMNTQVEATGMKVKATTSSNVVIKNADAGATWTRSADAKYTTINTLTPASTSLTTGVLSAGRFFYVANPATIDYDSGNVDAANTNFAAVPVNNDDANTYVSANTFTIAVEGDQTFDNLYVSAVTVSAGENDISKALRVAVVSDVYAYIFAPVEGYTASYKGVAAAGTGTDSTLSESDETITNPGIDATFGEVSSSNQVAVTIYIWYEGQDANCTSSKAINVEELAISVSFIAAN